MAAQNSDETVARISQPVQILVARWRIFVWSILFGLHHFSKFVGKYEHRRKALNPAYRKSGVLLEGVRWRY
jgi:hypothetical protein